MVRYWVAEARNRLCLALHSDRPDWLRLDVPYAWITHLLKKRMIFGICRKLLGQKRSKATEINTSITKKGWDKIKSPLSDLEI